MSCIKMISEMASARDSARMIAHDNLLLASGRAQTGGTHINQRAQSNWAEPQSKKARKSRSGSGNGWTSRTEIYAVDCMILTCEGGSGVLLLRLLLVMNPTKWGELGIVEVGSHDTSYTFFFFFGGGFYSQL
jgi:hypothetical protein